MGFPRRQMPEELLAMMAAQEAAAQAPKAEALRPPPGMDPGFYSAMLSAGAAPHEPPPAPQAAPPPMSPLTGLPAASLPPIQASIAQLPQQAPVMSQASPAPAVAARANINNNVTMPTPTFTPAQERPPLPTFTPQGLSPNLGNYGPTPSIPGYGMPRTGQPFKPPSMPNFAALGMPDFSGLNPAMAPQAAMGSPEDLYRSGRQFAPNLFNQYQ